MSMGAIGGSLLTSAVGGMFGGSGGAGTPSVQQTNPFGLEGGLFSGSGFNQNGDGNVQMQMNPQMQALQGQGFDMATMFNNQAMNNPNAAQAGQLGGDFMSQLQNMDPMAMQNAMFQQQAAMLQPGFDKQLFDQESRQFKMGTFNSSGGADQRQATLDSQNSAFGQLMANSFQQAQSAQAQTANMAGQFSQLDPQLRGLFQQMGTGGLNQGLNINASQLDTMNMGQGMASSNVGATAAPGPSLLNSFGNGLLTQGAGGLGDALGGLFAGAGAAGPTQATVQGPGTFGTNALFQNGFVGGF